MDIDVAITSVSDPDSAFTVEYLSESWVFMTKNLREKNYI
jgi:hypothetical protein